MVEQTSTAAKNRATHGENSLAIISGELHLVRDCWAKWRLPATRPRLIMLDPASRGNFRPPCPIGADEAQSEADSWFKCEARISKYETNLKLELRNAVATSPFLTFVLVLCQLSVLGLATTHLHMPVTGCVVANPKINQ
jgi:hypothetical protein